MSYDSDKCIQVLSPLMGKMIANMTKNNNVSVLDWAEAEFATPLGIQGVFEVKCNPTF